MPASPTATSNRTDRGSRDQGPGSPRNISSPVSNSTGTRSKPKMAGGPNIDHHHQPFAVHSIQSAQTKPIARTEQVPSQGSNSPSESSENFHPQSHPFRPPISRPTGSLSSGSLLESSVATSHRTDNDDDLKPSESHSSISTSVSRVGTEHTFHKKKDRKETSRNEAISPFLGTSPSFRRRPQQLRPAHRNGNGSASNLRTAPIELDPNYRKMMGSEVRNRSSDRAVDSEEDLAGSDKTPSENGFLKKFGRQINKGRDAFITNWKSARSGSAHERPIPPAAPLGPPSYKVIRLPLQKQTRITRIKKSMDAAKDKTEYWMPALAYRSIDYLNHNGIDQEGLYRIPGSVTEVKKLESMFDRGPDCDIDLLGPDIEINDVNIIGSMLKTWLREIPDELLPQESQKKIHAAEPNATQCPQIMRDELSSLPPWKYYLLFAITCHISLVNEHSAKNKMEYKALLVCWQGSIKIDSFCFYFLVCDWRRCWQGCWTEKEALDYEEKEDGRANSPDSTVPRRLQEIDMRSEPDDPPEKPVERRTPTAPSGFGETDKDSGYHGPIHTRSKRRSGRRPVSIATTSPQIDMGEFGDKEATIPELSTKDATRPFTSVTEA